jgi:uncharacterized membrane protein
MPSSSSSTDALLSRSQLGGILGGIFGFLVLVLIAFLVWQRLRRRRSSAQEQFEARDDLQGDMEDQVRPLSAAAMMEND